MLHKDGMTGVSILRNISYQFRSQEMPTVRIFVERHHVFSRPCEDVWLILKRRPRDLLRNNLCIVSVRRHF